MLMEVRKIFKNLEKNSAQRSIHYGIQYQKLNIQWRDLKTD